MLADLVVVPFHATATEDYAGHVIQEAQLALVFVDDRTLPFFQALKTPLCLIDRRSNSEPTSPLVVTIEDLLHQGADLRELEARHQAMAANLLGQIQGLAAIETGACVEIRAKGAAWVRGTVTKGDDTASTFNVKIEWPRVSSTRRRFERVLSLATVFSCSTTARRKCCSQRLTHLSHCCSSCLL